MEIKQCSPESSMGHERNKEIKDFLIFNKNDHKTPKFMGRNKNSAKRKAHSTKYLPE